ncbi:MAG: very short patch repair endonuclease [Verrucomicrobia bacterium]|nr:very short patch repair endonuclease [Verrucomicrobiota bacterium]
MAAVRSTGNKVTELSLVRIFRAYGIKGWRRHLPLPGKPDFVFQKERVAVFVDGCFWHGCPKHLRSPQTNGAYWRRKIATNRIRDVRVRRVLRQGGWCVLRVWEHELQNEPPLVQRLRASLNNKAKRS